MDADDGVRVRSAEHGAADVTAEQPHGRIPVVGLERRRAGFRDDDVGPARGEACQHIVHRGLEFGHGDDARRQARVDEVDDRVGAGVREREHVAVAARSGELGPRDAETRAFELVDDDSARRRLSGRH